MNPILFPIYSVNCTVFIVENGINRDTSQGELITAIRTRINYDETKILDTGIHECERRFLLRKKY